MANRAQREVTRFDFASQRRDMVDHHIAARGVRSESGLRAMRAVRREEFLPSNLREFAYEDSPLSIASGQTLDSVTNAMAPCTRPLLPAASGSQPLAAQRSRDKRCCP